MVGTVDRERGNSHQWARICWDPSGLRVRALGSYSEVPGQGRHLWWCWCLAVPWVARLFRIPHAHPPVRTWLRSVPMRSEMVVPLPLQEPEVVCPRVNRCWWRSELTNGRQ